MFALFSGGAGLLAVGLLVSALVAPTPSPDTMRRETNLFLWQDVGVIVQALAMLPVTWGIYRLSLRRDSGSSRGRMVLGLFAQTSLVLASALIFTGTVSDMLYMAPIGLVGMWLLLVNRSGDGIASSAIVWLGRVAGVGLLVIAVRFVIYGTFVAPAVFLRPLSNGEIDAQSLTPANLVAHVCMAVGTLLGRLVYPVWALFLGRRLLLTRDADVKRTAPLAA
jgi:hypothetical protein